MRAFLFSGQGSQKAGMADALLYASRLAADVYDEANALSKKAIAGFTADDLKQTVNTQLAVSVYSAALWSALPQDQNEDCVLAGFSLGEYSALYAAGVVDLPGLIQLILWRSEFMQDVIDNHDGLGMAAVIGLPAAEVERVLLAGADQADAVYAVNYNSPEQTVISGTLSGIARLKPLLLDAGAGRVLPLNVAGAFHSPFFNDAARRLAERARTLTFLPPRLTLYSNMTKSALPAGTDWPSYLQKTLVSPVYFTAELANLEKDGVTSMVEVGPGNTLQGLVRKTLPGMPVSHASDLLA